MLIKTYGQQVVKLDLGLRCHINWASVVADVVSPLIGADLLAHYGLLIDLKNHCLSDPLNFYFFKGGVRRMTLHRIAVVTALIITNAPPQYVALLKEYSHLAIYITYVWS